MMQPEKPVPEIESAEKRQLIEQLYRFGVDESVIAETLNVTVRSVKAAISFRQTETRLANPEDQALADAMRGLAWQAYNEARVLIEYGSPGEKLGLIKTILGRTAALVGTETNTHYDQMRNEFEEMMSNMRGGDDITDAELISLPTPFETDDN